MSFSAQDTGPLLLVENRTEVMDAPQGPTEETVKFLTG